MSENSSIYPLFGETDANAQRGNTHQGVVYFMRPELARILNVYGRLVSAGEWRDYAIDHLKDQAIFSIFRRASEMPVYKIIKEPARSTQQGMWRIVGMDGRILKRGHALEQLLRYFDRMLMKATD